MRSGICPKCSSIEVYISDSTGTQTALSTYPLLKIYKENKWVPDVTMLELTYYVCRSCGNFEASIRNTSELEKLDDCTNWRRVNSDINRQ